MPGLVPGRHQQCAWTSPGEANAGVGLSLEVLDQQCAWTSPGKPTPRSRTVPGSPGSAMCLD